MRELMSYLPENYLDSRETVTVQEAIQPETGILWQTRDDLLLQLDPRTATWGLSYWESAFGLATDGQKDLEQRRSRVMIKIRGQETTTPALIKALAESILGVPVTVEEIYSGYRVEVCFDTQGQLPAGMDDLKEILDEIMPAHLVWDYLITLTPTLYVGGQLGSYNVTVLPVMPLTVVRLTDEDGAVLTDENGAVLLDAEEG